MQYYLLIVQSSGRLHEDSTHTNTVVSVYKEEYTIPAIPGKDLYIMSILPIVSKNNHITHAVD
jgi:hypothetical protein